MLWVKEFVARRDAGILNQDLYSHEKDRNRVKELLLISANIFVLDRRSPNG
jgi:hypothetical protein